MSHNNDTSVGRSRKVEKSNVGYFLDSYVQDLVYILYEQECGGDICKRIVDKNWLFKIFVEERDGHTKDINFRRMIYRKGCD